VDVIKQSASAPTGLPPFVPPRLRLNIRQASWQRRRSTQTPVPLRVWMFTQTCFT
jgi:hypothetical protein